MAHEPQPSSQPAAAPDSERPSEPSSTDRLQTLASLGQLTLGVSHEFNNVLTAILGWAQVGLRDMANPKTVETALTIIEANSRRARRVVADLMGAMRGGSANELALISDVLDDTLRLLSWQLRNAGIAVNRDFSAAGPVRMDRGRIQQVFVNLCLNALQAMPDGGELTIRIRETSEGAEVDVIDSGRGMSEEVKEHAFDDFFSTKRSDDGAVLEGAGMGLSISRRIVEQHGGRIRLASEPGQGATFTVLLPRRQGRETIPPASPAVPEPLPVRVLVVDDEPHIRELLATALTLRGAQVEAAADAASSLDMLSKGSFELVLLDYTLPGTSAASVLGRMRALRPELPVFFISGRNGRDSRERFPSGAEPSGWIGKPFDLEEVYREVAKVVGRATRP